MRLFIENMGDPVIRVLLITLAVNVIFTFRNIDWFETGGIIIAILLATTISTFSEYSSHSAFEKLNSSLSKFIYTTGLFCIPIKEFMSAAYKFSEQGSATKADIIKFCDDFAEHYAKSESHGNLIINYSVFTMDKLKDKFLKLFRCLVDVGKPKKKNDKKCSLQRVELLWQEREYYTSTNLNEKLFVLSDILGIEDVTECDIDGAISTNDDII